MKIIGVASIKGGIGKSGFILHTSGFIAAGGNRVLIIDADPQANSTSNLKIDEENENFLSLPDVIEGEITRKYIKPEDVIIKSPISQLPMLDILPSSIYLTATEFRIGGLTAREKILNNYIKRNIDYFDQYDVIAIDTPPNMSCINQNCFYICDHVILISDISMNGFRGTQLFQTLWKSMSEQLEKPYNVSGFLINRYDKRISLSNDYIEFCKQHADVKDYLFNTIIPENVELKKAEISGVPINIYNSKCAGYNAYQELFLELIERGIV